MGKPRPGKGEGRRPRSSSEEEEKGPVQQDIKSYFGKESCQLWTTVGQETKGLGKRTSLKLSTKKDSKVNSGSLYLACKEKVEVNRSQTDKTTCLQNDQNKTELEDFTRLQKQNEKFKKPTVAQAGKVLVLTENNSKPCRKDQSTPRDEKSSSLSKPKNKVVLIEDDDDDDDDDDDLIPPTPSPAGQHSFINCRDQTLTPSTSIQPSQADDAKASSMIAVSSHATGIATNSRGLSGGKHLSQNFHNKRNVVIKRDGSKMDQMAESKTACSPAVIYSNKDSSLTVSSCKSMETPLTLATSRKTYKLSRKPKPPKFVSSPLKKHDISGSVEKSPHNNKRLLQKEAEQLDRKESTAFIAPSKCVVLRSRLKRSAIKGSSPLKKRLQTEAPLPAKNTVKHNLWEKLEECTQSNNSKEGMQHHTLVPGQCYVNDNNSVDNKSILEKYTMDKTLGNFCLEEKSVESIQSFDEAKVNDEKMIIDHNESDFGKHIANAARQISEQFNSPVKDDCPMETGTSLGVNNVQAQTPPSKTVMNTSVDSLADMVDIDNLLDGVEWSPVISCPENQPKISGKNSCKTLFSPAKITDQSQLISNDLQTKCILSGATCYSRFLVLEVSRRELANEQVIVKYGRHLSEKVLRLFDENVSQERFCSLREEWESTEVEPGDIVHITGIFDSKTGFCILDNSADQYLVVHPDTLVSGTTVSMATKCLRQSILNERFRTEDQSEAMLIGTLLHDLFDLAMEFHEFSPDALLKRACGLLSNLSYLDDLYSLGQTENWALEKLKEHIPLLCDWAKRFVTPFPHPDFGTMDFKTPEYPHGTEQPSVCVSALRDIEENIWSPRFGLKGKVDATVEVKIDRRPKIRRHKSDTGKQVQTKVMPLELKTGKMFTKLGSIEHRAQVILYTLLMSDRYSQAVDAGLLFYMKSAHMLSVPGFLNEKRALIMKRNEVARYLTLSRAGSTGTMPAMLKDLNTCRRCSQAQNCTTFHKAAEQGDGMTSGLGSFFNEMTDHMTNTYMNFFTNWFKLVCLEGKEMEEKRTQREIWCLEGWEREKLGRCFSYMVLKPSDHNGMTANSRYFRHTFERAADHPSLTPLQEVPITMGDRVILSEESRRSVALAAGYIHEVKTKEVVVLLDRDLTKRYDVQTEQRSLKLYRLDKDEEYSTLTTLWSNMAKLFKGDSDRDAQLRRQIIDLEPPVFSRRRSDAGGMSSQTSQITDYFSQQSPSQNRSQTIPSDPATDAILQELNSDQRKAVCKALCAQHYALILGMPGTGKTTTISCLVRMLVAGGKTVLLTSYTHTAVDNILLKLKEASVDFLRLGQVHKVLPELRSYSSEKAATGVKTVNGLKQLYESKSVVATTCLGVNHALFSQRLFDYCIVDEASQITQPVCIGPLRRARVFILVGDHYQLPPLVQSVEAREGGMDVSLFKRLSERHPNAVIRLEHQYRMNQDIMELSNTLIYENRLKCGTGDVARALLLLPNWDELVSYVRENATDSTDTWLLDALIPSRPVVFLDTDGVPAPETRSEHLVSNETEALLVYQLAFVLLKGGLQPASLGIISPYRHQLKLISQVFHRNTNGKQNEIEINTVDKYQGRDKSCIIVSLVRSNENCNVGDLLRDWRRVNVAVTRAKRKLILIGSLSTLKGSLLLQELFDLLERKDWVQRLPLGAHKLCEFVGNSSQATPIISLEIPRHQF